MVAFTSSMQQGMGGRQRCSKVHKIPKMSRVSVEKIASWGVDSEWLRKQSLE